MDITAKVGEYLPIHTPERPPEWPMYSFERPSRQLWNSLAGRLSELGWSEDQIKEWLQSKSPRYALDNDLGDAIEALGRTYAERIANTT